jgi:hypothetical protein
MEQGPVTPPGAFSACRDLVEAVTDYLEDAMPAAERAAFEAHLEGCAYCIEYLDQMREIAAGLGDRGVCADDLSPECRDGIVAAFHGWCDERGGGRGGAPGDPL